MRRLFQPPDESGNYKREWVSTPPSLPFGRGGELNLPLLLKEGIGVVDGISLFLNLNIDSSLHCVPLRMTSHVSLSS